MIIFAHAPHVCDAKSTKLSMQQISHFPPPMELEFKESKATFGLIIPPLKIKEKLD